MKNTQRTEMAGMVQNRIFTIIGTMLCIILIPVLIINITLITRSFINKSEVPKFVGYSPLIVLTGSMEPNIKSGDMIIVQQTNSIDIEVGDVIAFFDPDSYTDSVLTHRVTEIVSENGSLSFRTKGDANDSEDKTLVSADKLIGVYKMKISGAGNVAMFMQTTAGLVICVILPLILLIGYDLIRRRRFEKHNTEDTMALLAELEQLKAMKNAAENSEK